MKICTKCNEVRLLTEFYSKLAQCKYCIKNKRDSLSEEDKVKIKEYTKRWRDNNKEKIKNDSKVRYAAIKAAKPPKVPKIPRTYKDFSEDEKIEIKERNVKRNKENMPLYLWRNAKTRSGKKNLDFDIEVSDIIVPEFCPILGLRLEVNRGIKDNSISLDRIDSSKGYIKGNILVMSYLANAMKRTADFETLQKFALWVLSLESLQLET